MRQYVRKGLTQQQIVDQWEKDSGYRVSRSAIAMAMRRWAIDSAHPRPRYEETLPWHVAVEHNFHYDARMLRLEGRRRQGKSLREDDLKLLTAWLRDLRAANAVVTYDPDTPDGFYWVHRKDSDDDIIRRPPNKS